MTGSIKTALALPLIPLFASVAAPISMIAAAWGLMVMGDYSDYTRIERARDAGAPVSFDYTL